MGAPLYLGDTKVDADPAPVPATLVGGPGAWTDSDDATYVEVPYNASTTNGFGYAEIVTIPAVGDQVTLTVRYSSPLNSGGGGPAAGNPIVAIVDSAHLTRQNVTFGNYGGAIFWWSQTGVPNDPNIHEWVIDFTWSAAVVGPIYLAGTIQNSTANPFRLHNMGVPTGAPQPYLAPRRLYPREDAQGIGGGRLWPPPRTRRSFGGYY